MELKIYDKANNLRLTASPNSSSSVTEEIGGECSVSASFTHTGYVPLDVDDYIEVEGVRYKVKSRYRPKQKNTQTYEYSVKFYAPIHDAEDTLMLFQEGGTTSEFSYDGGPREHLQLWIDNMNRRAGGNLWSIGTVITAENKVIDYRNVKCWDAAFGSNGIAATFGTEMWADGYVINLCKAERGEVVELGYLQGLTNLAQEDNGEVKFFTRLFPLGSTRNIDATKYGYSRLQLPDRSLYVDKNVDLYGVKEETEEAAFAEIYPQYVGTVSSVRTEEKTSEEGRKYTVYYFKDNGMNWNPKDYEIPDLDYMLQFQTGELAGRGTDGSFQSAWHEDTREWEIINVYPDDTTQTPGGVIIPNPGDKYIPWNFAMPQEYITAAEQAYKQAVDDFLNTYSFDPNKYTGTTDRNYIEKNNTPLRIGWNVRLLSEQYFGSTGGYKDTRITKVQRKLNDLCQATITCSDEVGTGWKSSVDNSLNSLRYEVARQSEEKQIDVLKTSDTKTPSDYNVFSALKSLKTLLRKDQNDSTNYLLSLLGGAKIGKNLTFGEFITNVSGGIIDEKGIAELESLFLRSELIVPAIRYNFMTYFMGYNIISPGGGLKVKDFTDNGDGTWTVVPDLDKGIPCGQYVDDILTGFWYDKNADSGDFAGFRKMQFRVMSVDYDAKTFVMAPRPDTESVPYKELKLGQTGNFTNENRQTYIVIDTRDGSNCITLFEHANTWDPEPAQMPAWFGKKRGMTVQGINADNYSAVLQNIIMTGLIFQTDEITGESVRVPLWKGEWVKGKYGYFNEVSHNGSRWLCVNTKGTEQEPGTGVDWMVTVKKGEDGAPGLSVVGGGHWEASKTPYAANTMVTLANCVFLSNVETSNPPIRISRFKSGNYRRMKNGGYILAGKSVDWEVHSDWTMLLDGRELKGTSITFLGSFASAPANPKEGNSYYNTTDKCTYVYQNGVWMLMVSDGKDGRDYEYIYYRNNSIGIIPDKPDSQQQDDYVPEGWTADYLGVSEEYQVEWGCKRTKLDGVWSGWSTPAVVHRWSKDGESNVLADLDNEMVSCALTYEGKTTSSVSWVTNVGMWYGLEKLDLTSISYSDNGVFSVSANKETGAVTVSVQANASVPDTTNIRLTLTASKSGQIYSRDLVFTIAGVRAGSDGEDAVVYSLIPSATSVVKYKDGSYNVPSVSCTRQKTVGSTISETTDGELKYSVDGGAEQNASNGQAISSGLITKSVKFLLYVSGKLVDVETIPLITDGHDGTDGTSMNPRGNWVSSGIPYQKNDLVNFAYGTFVALRQTNNPPYPISRFKNGSYRRKKDGGYILAGNGTTLNEDWQVVTPPTYPGSYWLDCPVSSIGISSVGTPSPSSLLVTCKMNIRNSVQLCGDFYLVARKYNGSWIAHVSPIKSFELSVPATAGYTQFAVRAYRTASDASEWNENYVCEKGIGVSVDGSSGADAAFMYDNGPWKSGTTYVWNDTRRDKVIHPFNGVYYNFLVKNKGASVTVAPSSANGDSNWEAMNKLINIATDSLFADGANVASFLFKNGVLRSQDETDGVANIIMNGKTGYFHCSKADITGTINAIGGNFKNVTVQGTFRTKESGDRIELSTDTNTFSFIGSNNVHYMELFFNISGSTKSARMTLHDDYGNVTTLSPGTFNLDFNFSGVPADDNGETLTTLNYGLQIYNRTKDRLVFISPRKLQFNEGGIIYTGYTGTAEYVPPNGYSKTLYFKNGICYKIG